MTRLVGIYDADGGLSGETRYTVGHLLGRVHCPLCDITHGVVRRTRAFDDAVGALGVPFALVHRNEREADERAASGGALPCVLAEVDGRFVRLLDPDDLAQCRGEITDFDAALRAAVERSGLTFPQR